MWSLPFSEAVRFDVILLSFDRLLIGSRKIDNTVL